MSLFIETPIAIFFYNRPDTLSKVIESIKDIYTPTIYLISDGPDGQSLSDLQLVTQCREIAESYNGANSRRMLYRDNNAGLFTNVTEGIEQVFREVETCIFLEDDTVPNLSFFSFCDELLLRYRYNEEILMISGSGVFPGWRERNKEKDSYFFSRHPGIWGWASWGSKWSSYYDKNMTSWPLLRDSREFNSFFKTKREVKYWQTKFEKTFVSKHTWDHQISLSIFKHNLISILPRHNLVTNIGFSRQDAVHTKGPSRFANLPTTDLNFPLIHPKDFGIRWKHDALVSKYVAPSLATRIKKLIWRKLLIKAPILKQGYQKVS